MNISSTYINTDNKMYKNNDLDFNIKSILQNDKCLDFLNQEWINKKPISLNFDNLNEKIINFDNKEYKEYMNSELKNIIYISKDYLNDISNNFK